MNERIKELVMQAERFAHDGNHINIKLMMEKFAQLIVKDCIKVCDDTRKLTWTVPLKDDEQITACVCMIKRHFGVEE